MSAGRPAVSPATSVFINCPFDVEFADQRDAIVFTCVQCGFYPVLADSSGQSGRPRLDRILDALTGCGYSIHDLSRCRGEGDENLARFNMPLELGMAMAVRRMNGDKAATEPAHEYLILVPEDRLLYQRYVSDLAGLDPQTHDGSVARVVSEVLAWLLTAGEAPAEVTPDEILGKLPDFITAKGQLVASWQGGTVPWPAVVALAAAVAQGHHVGPG